MTITAVVFDWAGTLVDCGSRAPVVTLQTIFSSAGVDITIPEARLSMGIAKKDHIRSILEMPRVRAEWVRIYGEQSDEQDLEKLYAEFVPKQLDCLPDHSDLIPGAAACVRDLQSRGIRVGTTTGYTRPMLDYLLDRAAEQGLVPDCALCPDDVSAGRPAPFMCYELAVRLKVFPLWSMIKIGDTPSDMEEAVNAGMWAIGVTRTGNEVGLTEKEWDVADDQQRSALLQSAGERLRAAGAHFVVESISDCGPVLEEISARLSTSTGRPVVI